MKLATQSRYASPSLVRALASPTLLFGLTGMYHRGAKLLLPAVVEVVEREVLVLDPAEECGVHRDESSQMSVVPQSENQMLLSGEVPCAEG